MKFIKIILLSLLFFSNTSYSAKDSDDIENIDLGIVTLNTNNSSEDFLSSYQNKIAHIIKNYPQIEGKKLNAQIFDITNKVFYNFLLSSKGYKTKDTDLMAMMYFDQFAINKEASSFCFILYDSKSTLLKSYRLYSLFNSEAITSYLAAHEMGHCLYAHQYQIGNVKEKLTPKENEQIADMFSIAYFLTIGQKENAAKIIRNVKSLQPDDIHSNTEQLSEFFNIFIDFDNLQQYNDFEKLFKVSYKVFLQIKGIPQ